MNPRPPKLTWYQRGVQFVFVLAVLIKGKRVFYLRHGAEVERVLGSDGRWCYGFSIQDVIEVPFPKAFWGTIRGRQL